ncbi:hypothetical protein [Demequina litorisediminis]|uniref:Uncharacterized protein n=1 Tax=Demequina litorisediminis TaxID=1849022 RepID=A0ABQ6IKD3_9MICO|nr:hypothetical protein [Demequina litorisediminis]GMA37784.1 hypothetical protein GCM10025876_39880 [Demequina litorisediminis]GMA37844.1 hypothetical protein GCM10025876_40480 [Demequina litorisediminis]GMA37896.1 hypothetical protein GCM10025876_41000 [Demequina litorisediminis]
MPNHTFAAASPVNLYDENNECRHCGEHVADPHQPECVAGLGLTTTSETPLFWCEHSGRIVCFEHLGHYGRTAVKHDPRANEWPTPLNHWRPVLTVDRRDWHEEIGAPMKCESCPR